MVEDGSHVARLRSAVESHGFVKGTLSELLDMCGYTELTDENIEDLKASLAAEGLQTKPAISVGLSTSTTIRLTLTPEAREASGDEAETTTSANPGAAALAGLGGVLVALAAFLPLDEPSSAFVRVQSNSLIQHEGWWLIVLGALIVLTAASRKHGIRVCVFALLAGAAVIHFGSDKALRTLYPLGTNSEPNSEATGTVVPLGVAVYVAGVGAALALAGGWAMIRTRSAVTPAPAAATKRCPDCAETILMDAKVCKHCGYRFDSPPSTSHA